MTDEGFRTKSRTTKKGDTTGGGQFNNQHVHDILRNRLYLGFINFKAEEFKGLHEAIVDEATFNKVQDRLHRSRTDRRASYDRSDLLLLGLTKCGFCGAQMTTSFATKDGSKYLYYKCTSKTKYGASKCESRDMSAQQLENLIEQVVVQIGQDDAFFEAVFKQISVNDSVELEGLKKERDILDGNMARLKKESDNLMNAIAQGASTQASKVLMAKLDEATVQREAVEASRAKVQDRIEAIEGQSVLKAKLRKRYAEFGAIYAGLEKERKLKLIRALITEIGCSVKKNEDRGQIRISFRGDGTVLKDWDTKENPEALASRFRVDWLRG